MNKMTLVVAAIAVSAMSQAGVIFTNYDAGYNYTLGSGATLSGPTSAVGQSIIQGMSFISSETSTATDFTFSVGLVSGDPTVTFTMYSESGGQLGSQVGTSVTASTTGFNFGGPTLQTVDVSGNGWSVNSGSMYFIVADVPSNNWSAWNTNITGHTSTIYQNLGGQVNYVQGTTGAFELQSVPEPASMIALGAGLLALARRRRSA